MINEKHKSIYGIFTNKRTKKKLAFYPCPKNANTSAKLFFLKHLGIENEFIFIGDTIPSYKQTNNDLKGKKNLINFLPLQQPFTKMNIDIKCCLIRNPVDRFVSSYKNRILFHKDKGYKNHSINMILDKLEAGLFENKHFLPQSFFLGDDLNYFTFYANVKNIKFFKDKINDFFGRRIEFPKLQTGGKEFDVNLNNSQLNRISKIYAKDFELFGSKEL